MPTKARLQQIIDNPSSATSAEIGEMAQRMLASHERAQEVLNEPDKFVARAWSVSTIVWYITNELVTPPFLGAQIKRLEWDLPKLSAEELRERRDRLSPPSFNEDYDIDA